MATRYRSFLQSLVATAVLHGAAIGLAAAGSIGLAHRVPFALGIYHPWFVCIPPYGCHDPLQWRLERERDRRMQELRERAAQSDPPLYRSGDGPWGQQRYMPPATPEANIQPAYRGASQLRPEYEQSTPPVSRPRPD